MRIGDLTTGMAKLRLSLEHFQAVWRDVSEQWQDGNARAFEEEYLQGVVPRVKTAMEAMNRLSSVLAKAGQELEP